MSNLESKITALPKWPKQDPEVAATYWVRRYNQAALARLELAREWIIDRPHAIWCAWEKSGGDDTCTCGRDALLKALEVPR